MLSSQLMPLVSLLSADASRNRIQPKLLPTNPITLLREWCVCLCVCVCVCVCVCLCLTSVRQGQAFDFYMQLWKLFYGAYLVLPFAL